MDEIPIFEWQRRQAVEELGNRLDLLTVRARTNRTQFGVVSGNTPVTFLALVPLRARHASKTGLDLLQLRINVDNLGVGVLQLFRFALFLVER